MVNKSNIRTPKHSKQIKVEPNIAITKDLLVDDIVGHVIYFCSEATRIVEPTRNEQDVLDKNKSVVGMPVVSVKIGDHCYHGLCDMGSSVSVTPFFISRSYE